MIQFNIKNIKPYKKYIYLFFIFLITFIIIFYLNKNFKKEYKEHYLTYFLPYYDNEFNKIQKFYDEEDYKRLNYKKHFIYEPFNFGYHIYQHQDVIQTITKIILAGSKIKTCNNIHYSLSSDLVKDLNNNKTQMTILSSPIIAYFDSVESGIKNFNNVKLILKCTQRYVFFITKKSRKIKSITNFPYGSKIGTNRFKLYNNNENNFIAIEILNYLKYKKDIDYKLLNYDDFNSVGEDLINDKIDLIIWDGYFPNKEMTDFINKNASYGIILLPFNIPQEQVFKSTFYQYDISYIDLNKLSPSYFPVKINNESWNRFKPDLKILKFDEYLVSNRFVKNDTIYDFINTYYKYIKIINNINNSEQFYNDVEFDEKQIPILYHEGARKYYFNNGYMSNNANPNCKYLVGVMECNDKTLADNGFI